MRALPLALTLNVLAAGALLAPPPPEETIGPGEPITAIPEHLRVDERRVALGRRLFSDKRLSLKHNQSCATCHPLNRGGMDGLALARRADGSNHIRNTPTIFNVALNSTYNWDGVAYTLEDHTERVIPGLMKVSWVELLTRLHRDRGYAGSFQSVYEGGITRANVLDAIAVFEKSLVTPDSRFDAYLRGEHKALNENEKTGYRLFKAYGCITCHQGVNIGGNLYQKFGVFEDMAAGRSPLLDRGRIRITKVARDEDVFRVPSLRNVAVTAPYFHDGRTATLKEAVEIMAKAQLGRKLPANEIKQMEDFLRTLTGKYQGVWLSAPPPEGQ
jgi:cytochrome c peroxidase